MPLLHADRWFRVALSLWVVLFLIVTVKTLIQPERHTVYPLLADGARHWWSRQPLYDLYPELFKVQHEVFRYSPTCAIALSPLAPLPNRYGGIVWSFANLAVLAWGLVRAARDVLPGDWPARRVALLLVLVLVGTIRSAWNAQGNPMVAGLLLLGASAIARRRWWTASALLAIPVFLKLAPIAVALLLVSVRPRQLLGRFAIVLAVGAALPFATQPPAVVLAQYRGWFAGLEHSSTTRWPAFRDAWTLWELTGGVVAVRSYRLIQAGAGLATLLWCLRIKRLAAGSRATLTATLAMGLNYLMVFGPAVEYPTYVVLAPVVAWGVLDAFGRREGRVWVVLAYAMTMVLGSELMEPLLLKLTPLARGVLPAGSLLFALWLARHARRLAADPIPVFVGVTTVSIPRRPAPMATRTGRDDRTIPLA